jgi:hypothetical protein
MSFVAEAELTIEAPPQRIFDRLADFAAWPSWMPPSFVPVLRDGAPSPFKLGDRFRVRVGGAPVSARLRITVLERPRELGWRGGVRGFFWAEHRFVMEPDGDRRTRVRSIETWHGIGAHLARRQVMKAALRIGGEQLAGLAKAATFDSRY